MACLVDSNLLFFSYDPRYPEKQQRAREILTRGAGDGSVVVAHQAITEFVNAATKAKGGFQLLPKADAITAADRFMQEFEILYPNESVLRTALSGVAMYPFSWYDAHMWAYAEANGIPELLSEDLGNGRIYGSVRMVNPFLSPPAEL